MTKKHLDYNAQIAALNNQCPEGFIFPSTLKECNSQLRVLQKEMKDLTQCAKQLRQEALQARAEAEASRRKKPLEKIIKRIRNSEAKVRMFRKLNVLRKKNRQGGLSRLQVPVNPDVSPKTCTEWKSVELPKEINDYILARNRTHFGQAHGTPWTIPPLSEAIDFDAASATADLILEGDYTNPELDDLTSLMIKHMKRKANLDSIAGEITRQEFEGKIKAWKESTSTSPSGVHLGHLKAYFADHNLKQGTEEARDFEEKRQQILDAHLYLLNYAIRRGISYTRWQTIVNAMLEKDPGEPKIHRLCVIHLYEADYNLILGNKWRELCQQATKQRTINPHAYGSSPGHTAQEPVFMEEMKHEICRMSLKPLVQNDNDASSCYDRIIMNAAGICSRQHGMHRNICIVNGRTLKEAKYHLKTQLGVSEEFYQHCEFYPIYGSGQGSGNSPVIWLVISSVLYDCYEERAHGALFETVDRTVSIRLYMVGFVDDANGQTNDFANPIQPSPEKLNEMSRHDVQLWNDLLWRMGGLLELPKCSYHHIRYQFAFNGNPVLMGGKVGPPIMLQSTPDSDPAELKCLSGYSSHRTLGYHKAPAGNQRTAFSKLKTKSDQMGKDLRSGPVTRRESWLCYFAIYLPSVGYTLPVSFYTKSQLETVQSKAMGAFFNRCGFRRTTKQAVMYGPTTLGGAGFRHLYGEQGLGQVMMFLRHWRSTGQPSQMVRIALSWVQLVAGIGKPILQDTTTPLFYVESKWFASLRTFLNHIQATIMLDNPFVPNLQRENDRHIMDIVAEADFFPY